MTPRRTRRLAHTGQPCPFPVPCLGLCPVFMALRADPFVSDAAARADSRGSDADVEIVAPFSGYVRVCDNRECSLRRPPCARSRMGIPVLWLCCWAKPPSHAPRYRSTSTIWSCRRRKPSMELFPVEGRMPCHSKMRSRLSHGVEPGQCQEAGTIWTTGVAFHEGTVGGVGGPSALIPLP